MAKNRDTVIIQKANKNNEQNNTFAKPEGGQKKMIPPIVESMIF